MLYFDANANMYFLNIETCKCNISWSNQSFQAIFNTVKKTFKFLLLPKSFPLCETLMLLCFHLGYF